MRACTKKRNVPFFLLRSLRTSQPAILPVRLMRITINDQV
jgi:hypothetical protein